MPGRDAVPPPELSRDTPVADVFHPVEIRLVPIFGNELDRTRIYCMHALLRQRLRLYEPLRGDERLDDIAAAVTLGNRQHMGLDLFHKAQLFKIGHYTLARLE